MSFHLNSRRWKKWVRAGVVCLLALDLILLIVNWHMARAAPLARKQERTQLDVRARLLAMDVARAEAIARHLPEVATESDQFYADQFLPAPTGYSTVVGDLGEISGAARVQLSGVTFKQSAVKGRGVTEVIITAAVEGDYPGLIRFVNGLERSKNFYLLDSLTLASATGGSIKLNLDLRTYFRS